MDFEEFMHVVMMAQAMKRGVPLQQVKVEAAAAGACDAATPRFNVAIANVQLLCTTTHCYICHWDFAHLIRCAQLHGFEVVR